ncbi:MAG TPA: polymer-forming cytoskeletal protein [bacterium]|nr:polymer-forming cytoskeletal protein [bacterium]
MFGRGRTETPQPEKDIGLLGTDTKFEGAIRFRGTLRIDGTVVGNIAAEPGSGSVLIINQQATVTGDIVSDSVLISGRVEGNVHASERVEIFRSGLLRGDVFTADLMIEGGAEFHGYCHMANGDAGGSRTPPSRRASQSVPAQEDGRAAERVKTEGPASA